MAGEISDEVRRFIAEHIDSVSLLDVLLLLRAAPDKAWTADEVSRALVTGEELAESQLATLVRHRLAVSEREGFRYAGGARAEVVDDLAECYAKRRHTVIGLIYGADQRSATALADAFRIRRRKGDG